MAAPVLTPEEIAQLEKERIEAIGVRDAMLSAVPLKTARAAELLVADGSFAKFFTYYNDDIIGQYDAERKELNGDYIASPIVEADITNPASLIASRTTPSLPATDIIRIAEFDGVPLILDSDNEQQHVIDQAGPEDVLQNGISGTVPTVTVTSLTASALTASSTTLDMIDTFGPMSFTIGDVFIVHDGGTDAAVIEVTGVTDNAGGNPPYDITLDIDVIIAPAGTIASSSPVIDSFSGFNNTERTTKVASDSSLQPLMDTLIVQLEGFINSRIANLNPQLTALAAQEDPDAVAEIITTTGLVNVSKTFLTNYLVSTDISDTGLASLSTERGTRATEITTRLAQIVANFTGQTENYFNRRYGTGNDRGNTARGTLRLQKNSEQGIVTVQGLADAAQDAIDAIDAILA